MLTRNLESSVAAAPSVAATTPPASKTKALPSWEELTAMALDLSRDRRFAEAVIGLRDRGPGLIFRLARLGVALTLRDVCYQKFVHCTWAEIIELMADQVMRNRHLIDCAPSLAEVPPISDRTNAELFRSYDQMPCTRSTALRRVELARAFVSPQEPILLLGDDDMVSVELAVGGFSQVTAVDIDQRILDDIRQAASRNDVGVRLFRHDLSQPPPDELFGDYKLVLFDPQYTVAGVRMFLDAALTMTRARQGTLFVLSLHTLSLLRRDLPELGALFASRGVALREFRQGFNVYPVPARLKSLISLVNRFVIGSKTLATEGYAFPYFLSDVLVLEKL